MTRIVLFAVLGFVFGLAGCTAATGDEGDWEGSRSAQVLARQFLELDFQLAAGSQLALEFDASADLQWDVHSHDGSRSVTHLEGTGSRGSVNFPAPEAGLYSFFLRNAGLTPESVTLRYRTDADGELVRTSF